MPETKLTVHILRDLLEDAPLVRWLSGRLSQNVSIQDYQKHLDEKSG